MTRAAAATAQHMVRALAGTSASKIARLSVFDCALMLACLPTTPQLTKLREQLFARLHTVATPTWLRTGEPHTVFLALYALHTYRPASVQGERLAVAIQRLVSTEVSVGGPYSFTGDQPTIGANAVVAAFARRVAEPLPNVEAFLQTARLTDPFFTPAGVAYMLACAGVTRLHAPQQPAAFLIKRPLPAIVATAVALWRMAPGVAATQTNTSQLQQHILHQTADLFTTYNKPLQTAVRTLLHRIQKADTTHEISLLPYFFAQALGGDYPPERINNLCVANVCGWMAYTIYDNLLDGEGNATQLPLANIAMRESVACFRKALPQHVEPIIAQAFTTMDQANAWELAHCRFAVNGGHITIHDLPKYHQRQMLAARSFAHVLAPLALLIQAKASATAQATAALRHYLIARQLNDDLHDWQKDLRAGRASYVVTALLRAIKVRHGTHKFSVVLPALQEQFYTTTMAHICRQAISHIQRARQLLAQHYRLPPNNHVYDTFEYIQNAAEQSLALQTQGDDFLRHYTKV